MAYFFGGTKDDRSTSGWWSQERQIGAMVAAYERQTQSRKYEGQGVDQRRGAAKSPQERATAMQEAESCSAR